MIAAIREWAARHTADRRYSPVGVAFHWIMAALLSFQLYWGWYMSRMPVGGDKLDAYKLHSELGLGMLVLATLRFLWRTIVPGPINDADKLGWQTKLAYLTHALFYICFFGLPLSGWAMWSALGDGPRLDLLGAAWPQLPFHDIPVAAQWTILGWADGIHTLLILLLVALIPMHIGAALKHHFWNRHDVLIGMLPELKEDEPAETDPRHGLPGSQAPPAPMRG
ncbi:cytochrome b/b6 domain-containing protein (plasmid) [Sphingobium sp. WTD-1]|uniref:Cytochrome b/b6 domain-containing protein n=1 Tax=Sphingobium yanoikuyae TaxID=13690 RepID=A0A9X7UG79_SPHYA|nr:MULTISPECIES: cytochrome b/b6 domain-containing protein [Sphingomonadaceae]MAM73170.1 cytochrome B [Tistrella sp.]QNG49550.1 cytochrome b/b6 domain-containing protein [Sphingobium yanoikuyae]RSV35323.1 cytochrome b [Sphingomonas sp. ABOLE]WIA59250.1 cytochrome b/b6 domain-containing protein [Sphingobium sp. WTD-1]